MFLLAAPKLVLRKTQCMQSASVVPLLAAASSTWENIQRIPSQTWINLGICVLGVMLVLRTWHALRRFNDFAPWIVSALCASTIMCYWTYERTEPPFLTPVVERLTVLLPTKAKHQADLEKLRQGRDADIH
jgi:drug/metabolite transporter (DMT)-like permease